MAKKKFGFGDLYCTVCGDRVEKDAAVCPKCGRPYGEEKYVGVSQLGAGGIGYSTRDGDPCFKKAKKKNGKAAVIFVFLVSVGVAAYLLISKQIPFDAEGIRKIAIVLSVIWGIDILIWIASLRKKGDWEGVVERKENTRENRRVKDGDGSSYNETVDVYTVYFRTNDGRQKKEKAVNNSRLFDRLFEGERVRYIGRLGYYEKYDKSRDPFLPCAGCGSSRDAREEFCGKCGCVMLRGVPVNYDPRPQPQYAPPQNPQPPQSQRPAAGNFCPHCGARKAPGAKFCENCGGKF